MSSELAFVVCFSMIIIMKMLVFIIGYLVVRLGYQLMLAGAKGQFKFAANLGGFRANLASVSPGLLFVMLGVALDCYAIYVPKPVKMATSSPEIRMEKNLAVPSQLPPELE